MSDQGPGRFDGRDVSTLVVGRASDPTPRVRRPVCRVVVRPAPATKERGQATAIASASKDLCMATDAPSRNVGPSPSSVMSQIDCWRWKRGASMSDSSVPTGALRVTTCDTDETLAAASGLFNQYRHHYGEPLDGDERTLGAHRPGPVENAHGLHGIRGLAGGRTSDRPGDRPRDPC